MPASKRKDLIRLGDHKIPEKELYNRIVNKLTGDQFHQIIMSIQKDLDNEKKSPRRTS